MQKKSLFLSALVLLAMTVTACNLNGNGGGQSSGGQGGNTSGGGNSGDNSGGSIDPAASGEFSFNEIELNTAQDFHTANQKAYLNYSGQYYNITKNELDGFDAKGSSNDVSAPNPVSLSWDFGVPDGKTVSKYSVVFGQKSDLSDGYEVSGTTAKKLSFYNPYLGDNYFKVVATYSDGTKAESPIKVFKVTTQAPRSLKVGNMANCRDMGGRTTVAGGKVKQGLIYRTCGNKFNYSTVIDEEGKKVMLQQLGVKTEINVSDNTDYNFGTLLSGVAVKNFYMNYGDTPYSNLARNSTRVRQVMDLLADETNYPVFYHCRIGTDRTGITGVMIGGLLGIPFNEVIQDYLYSNFAPIDGQRYPGKTPDNNGDDIKKYIDEILALPGANFQEQTYLALRLIGVSAANLDKIINIMTEGTKANIPATAKIGAGDDLSSTVSMSTSTDYMNAEAYFATSSGKSVSYQTTVTQGKKDIIVYMASTNTSISSSNTGGALSNAITLKIDGTEKTMAIASRTLHRCGFGQTKQNTNKRLGYMFNILGSYDLTAGQHTVEIAVKSGTFNIATIAVADRASA